MNSAPSIGGLAANRDDDSDAADIDDLLEPPTTDKLLIEMPKLQPGESGQGAYLNAFLRAWQQSAEFIGSLGHYGSQSPSPPRRGKAAFAAAGNGNPDTQGSHEIPSGTLPTLEQIAQREGIFVQETATRPIPFPVYKGIAKRWAASVEAEKRLFAAQAAVLGKGSFVKKTCGSAKVNYSRDERDEHCAAERKPSCVQRYTTYSRTPHENNPPHKMY